MYTRLLKAPKQSFFLLGPRGTGKTTWLHKSYPRSKFFDLLDEGAYQAYLRDPALFGREVNALKPKTCVLVDEIQRLPNLLNEVHRAIESRKLRFALSGSSARKLRRGGVNLLAGRAVRRLMFPLTPVELGDDFNLEKVLAIGTLPLIWTSENPDDALEAYVQLYLKEEIQAEAIVRNLAGFARFLPVAAQFHGQVLNIANIARDAGVARTTVVGYVEILEDTLLAYRLQAYEGRLRVREKKHPKLYWVDPGIVRTLKHARGPVVAEEKGALLEGYVCMLLRAHHSLARLFDDLFYWSPAESNQTEVDFLLVEGREKKAVEVKATSNLRQDHFRGLKAIAGLEGLKRRLLVYLGERVQQTADGIEVWPFERFWSALLRGTL